MCENRNLLNDKYNNLIKCIYLCVSSIMSLIGYKDINFPVHLDRRGPIKNRQDYLKSLGTPPKEPIVWEWVLSKYRNLTGGVKK